MQFITTQFINKFIRQDDGQGVVEYGLVLGLVSIAGITVLTALGTDVSAVFAGISTALAGA